MLDKLKKYLPYILMIATFFGGYFLSGDRGSEKELIHKLETERKLSENEIKILTGKLIKAERAGLNERNLRHQDSLKNISVLKAKDEAYFKLKKRYESINLSRASDADLDSLRAGILALHPIK